MADDEKDKEKNDRGMVEENSLSKEDSDALLERVKKNLKVGFKADDENRKKSIEELKFCDVPGEQWTADEKAHRTTFERPFLTVNLMTKYLEQVIGDERKNKATIKVSPETPGADKGLGAALEGLIAAIEHDSEAESIYDSAFESVVKCGYGAWRILTRYANEKTFNQEIYLELVKNPFSLVFDPKAKDVNFLDAGWGFVLDKLPKDEFERLYPGAATTKEWMQKGAGLQWEGWFDGDMVCRHEYYEREIVKGEIAELSTGEVMEIDEAEMEVKRHNSLRRKLIKAREEVGAIPPQPMTGQPPAPGLMQPSPGGIPQSQPQAAIPGAPPPAQPQPQLPSGMPGMPPQVQPPAPQPELQIPEEVKIIRTRKTERYVVKRYVVSAGEILEGPAIWPGQYIPLIPVFGKETNVEGKRWVRGLTRHALDAQRMYNYWITLATETIALAPKAPFLATVTQIKGFEQVWKTANVQNHSVLPYNVDDQGAPPPIRLPAGDVPGILNQIELVSRNVKDAMGMSDAPLGSASRDQSGKAVKVLRDMGETSTFSFYDNLLRSIIRTGMQIVDIIPKVYDTEQDVKIKLPNNKLAFTPVNTTVEKARDKAMNNKEEYPSLNLNKLQQAYIKNPKTGFNMLSKGEWGVNVGVGMSVAAQKIEAAQNLIAAAQYMPSVGGVLPDIIIKNMEMSEEDRDEAMRRVRMTLPPGMVEPEPGQKPMQPPPQVVAQMKLVEVETMKAAAAMKSADARMEKVKADTAGKAMEVQSKEKIAAGELTHKNNELTQQVREAMMEILQHGNQPPAAPVQ